MDSRLRDLRLAAAPFLLVLLVSPYKAGAAFDAGSQCSARHLDAVMKYIHCFLRAGDLALRPRQGSPGEIRAR
jgi:hypothetical protein